MVHFRFTLWVLIVTFVLCFLSIFSAGCDCPGPISPGNYGVIATELPNNQLLFTDVRMGSQKTMTFLVYNDGKMEMTIESFLIEDDDEKVFTVVKAPSTPVTIRPGKANGIKVAVRLSPTTTKLHKARLVLMSNDAVNVRFNGDFPIVLRQVPLLPDPVLACNDQLDFGAVNRGASKTLECEVHNRGNGDWIVSSVAYQSEKGEKQDFSFDANTLPFTIAPGEGKKLKVSYSPKTYPPKESQGVFVFESNLETSNDSQKLRLRVVGTIKVPLVELIPVYPPCSGNESCQNIDVRLSCVKDASGQGYCRHRADALPVLKFPLTSKGKTTIRTFLLRSTGDLPLVVESIAFRSTSSHDFLFDQTGVSFPFTLQAGQEKELSVAYTPSDEVEDKGTLEIKSNAANIPVASVLVEASSRGCNLEVLPRKLSFPGARKYQVTLTNQGNEPCVVQQVFLKSKQTKPFALIPTPAPNQVIGAGGRVDFLVAFTPFDKNEHVDAIVVKSSDPDEPEMEIELKGGPTADKECDLRVSPSQISFQTVPVGRSKTIKVSVSNKGWGDCQLQSLTVQGTNPAGHTVFQLGTKVQTPAVLATGKALRLEVHYTPTQAVGYEGELVIKEKSHPLSVPLRGNSGSLCLEIVPAHLDFGSTKVGCGTRKQEVLVYHVGASGCLSPITIDKLNYSQTTSREFRINSAPVLPKNLYPGESIKVDLSYKANDLGVDTGTFEVHNNVPGQDPVLLPVVGEGVDTDAQRDVFKQRNKPLVDILFVVDDSGSMSGDQQKLASNFKTFITWASNLNVDFHIGVISTDVTTCSGHPCRSGRPPGCLHGSIKYITPSTPNLNAVFQTNAIVGTSGSAVEKGLEAAYKALSPPMTTDPKCNLGFYRPDASLSMVFISDENDQSPNPIHFYVNFFRSLKGSRNADLIRASGIGPSKITNGTCSGSCRYFEVSKQMKGIYQEIRSTNWKQTMTNIASASFGYRSQFFLSRKAAAASLSVKVNGVVVIEDPRNGWQYDPVTNSISFSKGQLPPPGATIQVAYKAVCLP